MSDDAFADLLRAQSELASEIFGKLLAPLPQGAAAANDTGADSPWAATVERMQAMWRDFQANQAAGAAVKPPTHFTDPAKLAALVESWYRQMPLADPQTQKTLWEDGLALWETVLGQYGIGPRTRDSAPGDEPKLPRSDRRFADPRWREQPFFALIHQAYLMFAEQAEAMADRVDGLEPAKRERLRFLTAPSSMRSARRTSP